MEKLVTTYKYDLKNSNINKKEENYENNPRIIIVGTRSIKLLFFFFNK